ncbi:MAG: histidine--tRNA ligase [Candidatus Desulfofervidaceae bacterium]|nr:histidine--tRNA ligase [Candidatus Desulfofervidaceae bacterium]
MRIQTIRGFRDILSEEAGKWRYVEDTAREVLDWFGFKEVRLPILEKTSLFARSIGENTDIVEKEMYTFTDKSGDSLTLRPEATASMVRMFIQHSLYGQPKAAKLFTIGPMFRRERPQKGRYRQFWQVDAEMFGFTHPLADAEIINVVDTILKKLVVPDYEIHLNSLGCQNCRKAFKKALQLYLEDKYNELCPDCQRRYKSNPLRVFDCKIATCKEALKDAPLITDYLCSECQTHFDTLQSYLSHLGIAFTLNPYLVRGLDYYTKTTFEVIIPGIGAQNAVAGGGRYDNLIKELGGKSTPAIGFAIGMERLIPCVPDSIPQKRPIFLALLGAEAVKLGLIWAKALREGGIWTEIDYRLGSLKSQLNRANRLQAAFTLIIGEDEIKNGKAILRNMDTKEQINIPVAPEQGLNIVLKILGREKVGRD